MALGIVPVDEAVVLAGLTVNDLYKWAPGNTVAAVPANTLGDVVYYDSVMLGVKIPGAPPTCVTPAGGVVPVEFGYSNSAEKIADLIRKALSKYSEISEVIPGR